MANAKGPPAGPKSRRGRGRPKGVPNKFGAQVKDMFLEALERVGDVDWLEEQAREHPKVFLASITKMIPSAVEAKVEHSTTVKVVDLSGGTDGSEAKSTQNK